ncbi:MAG: hypothetical protein LJE65_01405, partial [Desulfobacteraceae bacterium]|nr:hypothetical protein [Desulfobacteraceae bacterium]
MDSKNIYIALAVVLVAAVAFFGWRHFKGKEDIQAHRSDAFERMTQAANTIPDAGMVQMAKIIQKYKADTGSFPSSLQALYPNYIPYKPFLDQVQWDYQPSGSDFSLSKSVTVGKRTMVASTNNSLKISTEGGIAAAARGEAVAAAETDRDKAARLKRGLELLARMKAPEFEPEQPQGVGLGPLRTETRFIQETEEKPPAFAADVSRAYLVWKNEDGQLGFGNIQYPRAERFEMAADRKWFSVRYQQSDLEFGPPSSADADTGDDTGMDSYSEISRNFLVWRDDSGQVGIGNVAYPKRAEPELEIATPQQWQSVQIRAAAERISPPAEATAASPVPGDDRVPKAAAGSYLVWRDSDGNIGFGNTDYPSFQGLEAIYFGSGWEKINPGTVKASKGGISTLPRSMGKDEPEGLLEAPPSLKILKITPRQLKGAGSGPRRTETRFVSETGRSVPEVVGDVGPSYIVWKNEEGNLGFGNIQYPHSDRFDVATGREWYTFRYRRTPAAGSGAERDSGAAA